MNKSILTTGVLLFAAFHSMAQQQQGEKMKRAMDSIKSVYIDMAALRNPIMRQAGISFDALGEGRFTSKLNGNPLFKSRMRTSRATAWFNVPIARIGKNNITSTFAGRRQTMKLSQVESYDPSVPVENMELHKNIISASLTATRIDSLFNRPVVYSATATAVADPETWQKRLVFTGVFLITIKQKPNTSLSVGVIGLLDPSAPFPIIPVIRYYHRFTTPKVELFFDPSRIALRKELSSKNFLWLSNDISTNFAMFDVVNDRIPRKSLYTTLELKSGLIYEHRLTKKVLLNINGGICSTLTSKLTEQNRNTDPFIKNKQTAVPYIQFGISCLPFWKGLAQK